MAASALTIRKDKIFLLIALFIIPITIGALSILLLTSSKYPYLSFHYGILFSICVIIVVSSLLNGGFINIISPLNLTIIGFLWFLIIPPMMSQTGIVSNIYSNEDNINSLILIIWQGIIGFLLGFYFSKPFKKSKITNREHIDFSKIAHFVLLIEILFVFIAMAISKLMGASIFDFLSMSNYSLVSLDPSDRIAEKLLGEKAFLLFRVIRWLPLIVAPFIYHCINSKSVPRFEKFLIFLFFILMLLRVIGSNARGDLLMLLGPIIIITLFSRKFTAKQWMYILITSFIIIFLAILQIKTRSFGGLKVLIDPRYSLTDIWNMNQGSLLLTYDENQNLFGAIKAEAEGKVKYLYGESYVLSFVLFIPRSLWKNKPGGPEMYSKMAIANIRGFWSTTYSILGEIILNFGSIFVAPFLFLWGMILKKWWTWFLNNRYNTKAQFIYSSSVIPIFLMVRGPFHVNFSSFFYPVIAVLLIIAFSKRRRVGRIK